MQNSVLGTRLRGITFQNPSYLGWVCQKRSTAVIGDTLPTMKVSCPTHGPYELNACGFPECPECIRGRFKFANGDDPKHSATGAAASTSFASFKSDQVKSDAVFNHMAANSADPSGCMILYHTGHKSFNAVSYQPCEKIPGSGISPAGNYPCHLAILQDLAGKSSKGPHWAYEEVGHFNTRIAKGEFIPAPRCIRCGTIPVYVAGSKCPACIGS